MNRRLRWFAVVPVAIVAWFLAALIGFALLEVAAWFCPKDMIVSGTCAAPWYFTVEKILIYFGIALSGVLVVVLSALAAPSHRRAVAWGALAIGSAVAFAIAREVHPMTVTPIITGAIAAAWVSRKVQSHDA